MKTKFQLHRLAVLLLLLSASLFGYAQTVSQQIDSIEGIFSFYEVGLDVRSKAGFNIYVSDTAALTSINIKLGNTSGSNDIYENTFSVEQLTRAYNATLQKFYYYIYTGHFDVVPAFVESFLVTAQGNSAVRSKQFVY